METEKKSFLQKLKMFIEPKNRWWTISFIVVTIALIYYNLTK